MSRIEEASEERAGLIVFTNNGLIDKISNFQQFRRTKYNV